jgi:hypothetical protein
LLLRPHRAVAVITVIGAAVPLMAVAPLIVAGVVVPVVAATAMLLRLVFPVTPVAIASIAVVAPIAVVALTLAAGLVVAIRSLLVAAGAKRAGQAGQQDGDRAEIDGKPADTCPEGV